MTALSLASQYGQVLLPPPLRTFIKDNDLSGMRIATFTCQSGSGTEKVFEKLKVALEIERLEVELILIDSKVKPNGGNKRKLREFCDAIRKL